MTCSSLAVGTAVSGVPTLVEHTSQRGKRANSLENFNDSVENQTLISSFWFGLYVTGAGIALICLIPVVLLIDFSAKVDLFHFDRKGQQRLAFRVECYTYNLNFMENCNSLSGLFEARLYIVCLSYYWIHYELVLAFRKNLSFREMFL